MLKELLPLRGIVTVLNTSFTDQDAVDLGSLRRNVRRALETGVAGFLVPAMARGVGKLSGALLEPLLRVEGTYARDKVRPPILPFDSLHRPRAAALIGLVRALSAQVAAEG